MAHAILRVRMSRENVDMALLMYERFIRRDLDALLPFMHDEVEIEPRLGALGGRYRGHEGARRRWSDLPELLPDARPSRGRAHGAASSVPVVETWWQSMPCRDGRCMITSLDRLSCAGSGVALRLSPSCERD